MKCKCLNPDFATMTGRGKGDKGLGKGGAKSHSPFWCFVITFRESPTCRIRGEPKSSNWLVLYDQSEIIKVLMFAEGVNKKWICTENFNIMLSAVRKHIKWSKKLEV